MTNPTVCEHCGEIMYQDVCVSCHQTDVLRQYLSGEIQTNLHGDAKLRPHHLDTTKINGYHPKEDESDET